jgi:hypothetical protein
MYKQRDMLLGCGYGERCSLGMKQSTSILSKVSNGAYPLLNNKFRITMRGRAPNRVNAAIDPQKDSLSRLMGPSASGRTVQNVTVPGRLLEKEWIRICAHSGRVGSHQRRPA